MATTLAGSVSANVRMTYTNTLDINDATQPLSESVTLTFTNGTGANQCDLMFSDTRSVTSGSPDDLDLAGVLTTAFGATITMARVKLIYIKNNDTTNILNVGAGTNPLINWVLASGDGVNVRPGGFLCLGAPDATAYAVTAATGDILRVAAAAGTISYTIIILGASA